MMLYQKIEENADMQKKLEQAQMDQSLMRGPNPESDCIVSDKKPLVSMVFGSPESCRMYGNP